MAPDLPSDNLRGIGQHSREIGLSKPRQASIHRQMLKDRERSSRVIQIDPVPEARARADFLLTKPLRTPPFCATGSSEGPPTRLQVAANKLTPEVIDNSPGDSPMPVGPG